jgi:hypothetical protein
MSHPEKPWVSYDGQGSSSADCARTAFGVASPYTVSIARLRIALEALNPKRITACRHDGRARKYCRQPGPPSNGRRDFARASAR